MRTDSKHTQRLHNERVDNEDHSYQRHRNGRFDSGYQNRTMDSQHDYRARGDAMTKAAAASRQRQILRAAAEPEPALSERQQERLDRIAVGTQYLDRIAPVATGQALSVCTTVAASYRIAVGDLYGAVLDSVASWLGGMDPTARADRLANQTPEHWFNTIRGIAYQQAPKMPSGGGSMPKLVEVADAEQAAKKVTVNGVPMSDAEQALWIKCHGFERAEGNGRWLDSYGEDAPSVGIPHPYGQPAPAQPERDSFPTDIVSVNQHQTAPARMTASQQALWGAALDSVYYSTRATSLVDWKALTALTGKHASTLQRNLRAAALAAEQAPAPEPAPASTRARAAWPAQRHQCGDSCQHSATVQGYTAPDSTQLVAEYAVWLAAELRAANQ